MTTKRGKAGNKRRKGRLIAHPAFAPILGLWGAALAGLAVMVLPAGMIGAAATRLGLGAIGLPVQSIAALLAAFMLGGGLYAGAATLSRAKRSANAPSIAEVASRRMRTIDPVRDLGSASLDEPVAAMPFAHATKPAQDVGDDAPPPRELNLAEFAAFPGRNAVWVEEGGNESAAESPAPAATAPLTLVPPVQADNPRRRQRTQPSPVGAAALARLRAVPTQELSLLEMVERFAGALHDHRSGPPRPGREDAAGREAALAEALRALAALSGNQNDAGGSEPLREAIARLQEVRGAA